ncbi:phosphoribosyltransferase-like protein [Paracoccus marcusii]|uniref:phosphoribosyltransferase-like protein n=1 Tax=Paracoccus marcusii TaxID=59779 RepID=UPI0024921D92|nr:hypothetical protein [Paracoccus marcusii]
MIESIKPIKTLFEVEQTLSSQFETSDGKKDEVRHWLNSVAGLEDSPTSIADALKEIASTKANARDVSVLLIRSLHVKDVVPSPNNTNQIERLIVEICENGTPDLVKFACGEAQRLQTYQKFAALEHAHSKIEEILLPLAEPYGDISALVSARRKILGNLNHTFTRQYCSPFGLQELKAHAEAALSKLERLTSMESSFLQDYAEAKRAISEAIAVTEEHKTFLSINYFLPLLNQAIRLMDEFISSVRQKYSSDIIKQWPDDAYLKKGYPLHEEGRSFHLTFSFKNVGSGFAENATAVVVLDTENISIRSTQIALGNIRPGDFSVTLDATVHQECPGFSGIIELTWGEIGNSEEKSVEYEFKVRAQSKAVDWPSLEYASPYSTDVAEGDGFIGRRDVVKTLAGKILRNPMEPFYITGQKRVGKTSLALAAVGQAQVTLGEGSIKAHYILWGEVAHHNPTEALNQLGRSIDDFIRRNLPREVNYEAPSFDGSLAPLMSLLDFAIQVSPKTRFVFIIDEFDEIPQELFMQGNIAETFFANLRALSRRKNTCLVLVGGENMPFVMERQGQKLNNFARINLSYFTRQKDWEDFQQLVRAPSEGAIIWHEDAVNEIFAASNGNPYFAKLICAEAFQNAVAIRDTEVTDQEIVKALDREVSDLGANSFAHLWQDGIPKAASEREPDVLRRSRTLVAAAKVLKFRKESLSQDSIAAMRHSGSLTEGEIAAVLNDFVQRNVLKTVPSGYVFVLPIFEKWLVESGMQQLISDTLGEELAQSALQQEVLASIKSNEIVELTERWPTYRGQIVGPEKVRTWFEQVPNTIDQRILFEILKRTKFVSEIEIREKLRQSFSFVRQGLPVPVQRSKHERREDLLITYTDGEGKSGSYYARLFADENRISHTNIISKTSFAEGFAAASLKSQVSAVVIIDDLAASGESLSENISAFINQHSDLLKDTKVRVVSLLSTDAALAKLEKDFSQISTADVTFRTCEVLDRRHYALPQDNKPEGFFVDSDRAKALFTDLGVRIDKRRPLGYGNMGLLVIFPDNAPNNTLPILRSFSKSSLLGSGWRPLFERVSHL